MNGTVSAAVGTDVSPGNLTRPVNDPVLTPLLTRLALMPDVARAKFAAHQAIDDAAREDKVMDAMASAASRLGLEPASSRQLSRALINAAKAIQRKRIAAWTAGERPAGPLPDLVGRLRPAIDHADDALLRALASGLAELQSDSARLDAIVSAVAAAEVDHTNALAIREGLAALQYRALTGDESRLDLIAARGVLRVGMSGDYAPFAYPPAFHPPTGSARAAVALVGIDVDLAGDLAASLGARLQIVATSWPTLTADLAANRFDIGMGGVTRTLSRARTVLFSDAYLEDGKSALARCEIAAGLTDLAHIDRVGVRVIVNPGGTNEQFARTHITRATIQVHPDNVSIFKALAEGTADVMFTDLIEARWQARNDPRLCVALGGARLSRIQKTVLLPRDPALQQYVNLWLRGLQESGRLTEIVSQHAAVAPAAPAHKARARQ